jgi:putative oxidoreductase
MHDTTLQAPAATWRARAVDIRARLARVPLSLILLAMRVAMGFVFFNAGLLKARSFEFAVKLFAEEYRLPIIPPEIAARLAMTVELGAPLFLFAGLATRLATLPLLAMTLVIVTLVYPASWVESLLWGSVLVMILTRGPGVISLDHLIDRWFEKR